MATVARLRSLGLCESQAQRLASALPPLASFTPTERYATKPHAGLGREEPRIMLRGRVQAGCNDT